jgi:TP901-1 family phage major tail protein
MATTITKDYYPGIDGGSGISGKRIVMYLNYGENATENAPVWKLLGGVTSNSFSVSGNTNDAQTKDMGYWSESVLTSKTAEISCEMMMLRNNEAQAAIKAFIMDDEITAAKQALMIALVDLDTKEYTQMWIVPTSWELTADSEDMVTYSLTATVSRKLVAGTDFKTE